MKNLGRLSMVAGALVVLVLLAGFFYGEKSASPARDAFAVPAAPPVLADPMTPAPAVAKAPAADPKGLLSLTSAPGYRRAGDLSLRVQDCTKAEDELEVKLQEIHGEIAEMLMEGAAGSRTCSLSVVIPADKFHGFIVDLRKMGSIQSERITATRLRPGQAEAGAGEGNPDPRELSLVSLRLADEKIAQTVLEGRGVLSSSLDRSTAHFLKGVAVLVELIGLGLPFAIAFFGMVALILLGARIRRPKAAFPAR